MSTKAYKEGKKAREQGITDCPYSILTDEEAFYDWNKGFIEGGRKC